MKRLRVRDLRDALPPDVRLQSRVSWDVVLFYVVAIAGALLAFWLFPGGAR